MTAASQFCVFFQLICSKMLKVLQAKNRTLSERERLKLLDQAGKIERQNFFDNQNEIYSFTSDKLGWM
jgi:hypothetical protein